VNGILHKSVTGEDKQLCCYIVLNTQDAVSQLSELQTGEKCTNICQTCNVCTVNTHTRYGGITAFTRIQCNLYHTFEQMDWERLQTKAWGYLKNITLWAGNESIRGPTSKHIWCPSIVLPTKWQLHDFRYITEKQQDVMCSTVLVKYSAMKSKTEIAHC
jgi:hypothetical protein